MLGVCIYVRTYKYVVHTLYVRCIHDQVLCVYTATLSSPTQIPLPPDSLTPRFYHSGGVVHLSATHKLVLCVGGISGNPSKYSSAVDWPLISDTTVLELSEWSYHVIIDTENCFLVNLAANKKKAQRTYSAQHEESRKCSL